MIKFCVLALGKQWQIEGFLGNEGTKKWMDKYPDIIVGMGHVELGPVLDPVEKISRLRDQGFEGLKFLSPIYPYNDERFFPYYQKAQELHMPILFHTGCIAPAAHNTDPEYGINSEFMRPYAFDKINRNFPDLTLIGAHLGMPHTGEALNMMEHMPNVYFDFSGGSGKKFHVSKIKKALSPFPGTNFDDPDENIAKKYFNKFVFGTDNPPVRIWRKASEDIMDYFHIDNETREDFYWRNAARSFGWDDLFKE